ncbi:MAG: type II 3-dehydroquinate dehydratase [Spirochaetes bacterium]|nr:type II 3-dehydroquinate dehydratase [Spirochaetota bacterium]
MKKILIVNGPNLNLLGTREPDKYGQVTLEEIEKKMKEYGKGKNLRLEFFQSNSEGEIIDCIQKKAADINFLIINPGAYTHTSVAIRDTILGVKISTIEVHLSNIYSREEFRRKSLISDIALGVISGFGWYGYLLALDYINFIKEGN